MVKFGKTTLEEDAAIESILDRFEAVAWDAYGEPPDRTGLLMDLLATHHNVPLDFRAMDQGRDFDLIHDVAGIHRHLDRDTGMLTGGFLPRYAKNQTTGIRE